MVAYVGERRTGTVAGQLPEAGVTTPGTEQMSHCIMAGSDVMTFRQSHNRTSVVVPNPH
jgi:hypothetical protein